jgi:tRNA threonylcarbamoyl adenosine modification protein (Sua5/YciO/YrdC/YwlC family)
MSVLVKLHENNPDPRRLREVVEAIQQGNVVVVPTDTVYSFAAMLGNSKGFDRIARLKGLRPEKAHFSLLCADLSELSRYTQHLSGALFKLMKRALPGPYTFVLPASGEVPKLYRSSKKTIGIRVPSHPVAQAILRELPQPLIVSSVHDDDDLLEYTTDPELILERWGHGVDLVVDGGLGQLEASTVIDCTSGEPEVVREGLGPIEGLF